MFFDRKRIFVALIAGMGLFGLAGEVGVEETDSGAWYVGGSGCVCLPGNGNSLKRGGGVAARVGTYVREYCAVEGDVFAAPNLSSGGGHARVWGGSVQGLWHASGWEAFDKLFGCERFDPFVTAGFQAAFASRHAFGDGSHRSALGPSVGIGAFYHLTDQWSLRVEARAALAVDSPCGMLYSVAAGLQFGGE